jgi:hypothetical protein
MRGVSFQHLFTPSFTEISHVTLERSGRFEAKSLVSLLSQFVFLAISLGTFTFIFTALFHYFLSTLSLYIAIPITLR